MFCYDVDRACSCADSLAQCRAGWSILRAATRPSVFRNRRFRAWRRCGDRFRLASDGGHFGVALLLGEPGRGGEVLAELRFLAPELAGAYLVPGAELLLMEGPRPVAEAIIVTLNAASPEVS